VWDLCDDPWKVKPTPHRFRHTWEFRLLSGWSGFSDVRVRTCGQ
jgi:integrase